MTTIYEKTNTTITEVLEGMIINPIAIFVNGKQYNTTDKAHLQNWIGYFKRNNKIVKSMRYIDRMNVLEIITK
jgi:hypothetical protein